MSGLLDVFLIADVLSERDRRRIDWVCVVAWTVGLGFCAATFVGLTVFLEFVARVIAA